MLDPEDPLLRAAQTLASYLSSTPPDQRSHAQMLNLDPNMNFSGRRAFKTIRLTFGIWDYRKTVDVTVGGNCSGFTNIHAAISKVHDQEFCGRIILERENGDQLECCDDEGEGEDWLADMLVSAEVISVKPQSN